MKTHRILKSILLVLFCTFLAVGFFNTNQTNINSSQNYFLKVQQIFAQSCPGEGELCGGLDGTHCNTTSCCTHTCIDGVWGSGTPCGAECQSNPLCYETCNSNPNPSCSSAGNCTPGQLNASVYVDPACEPKAKISNTCYFDQETYSDPSERGGLTCGCGAEFKDNQGNPLYPECPAGVPERELWGTNCRKTNYVEGSGEMNLTCPECTVGQVDGICGDTVCAAFCDNWAPYCEISNTPTPIPERTLSGTVYCQDDGGPVFAIGDFELNLTTWTPSGGLIREHSEMIVVNAEGDFSTDLTTGDELFALKLPLINGERRLPDGELSSGQPYSDMLGPSLVAKDYCIFLSENPFDYDNCRVNGATNHSNFNFAYTNCSPTDITPTPPAETYPMCTSITMVTEDSTLNTFLPITNPQRNQNVRFICEGNHNNSESPIVWVEFRVLEPAPTSSGYRDIWRSNNEEGESDWRTNSFRGLSDLFIIPEQAGEFAAQCRICTNPTSEHCNGHWEPVIWQNVVPDPSACTNETAVRIIGSEESTISASSNTHFSNLEIRVRKIVGRSKDDPNPPNDTEIFQNPEQHAGEPPEPLYTWIWSSIPIERSIVTEIKLYSNADYNNPGTAGECVGEWIKPRFELN